MKTLSEPTETQKLLYTYNRGMRAAERSELSPGTKYVVCLIALTPDMTAKGYAALTSEIKSIAGVKDVSLVIEHQTRDTIPEDYRLIALTEVNLRLEPVPQKE